MAVTLATWAETPMEFLTAIKADPESSVPFRAGDRSPASGGAARCECASKALTLTLPLTSMLTLMSALCAPVTATDLPDPYAAAHSSIPGGRS